MPSNANDIVTSYVRQRIAEWRDSGRELQELARAAGLSKSNPSMVLKGTGVGGRTGPGYARAFGFRDYDAMKMAAFDWWKAHGREGAEAVESPYSDAMREAIEAVTTLGQGTPAQIERIVTAYAHERFRDRDKDWWLRTLLEELARDRQTLANDESLRSEISKKQRETRKYHVKHSSSHELHEPTTAKKKRAAG